jgi:hypothetical protein
MVSSDLVSSKFGNPRARPLVMDRNQHLPWIPTYSVMKIHYV